MPARITSPQHKPPGQQQMAGFLAEEGDRERGPHRDLAQDRAAIARDAARHVDRNHQGPAGIEGPGHPARGARQGPRQPGPEQRVDHHLGVIQQRFGAVFGQGLDRAVPECGVMAGGAREPVSRAQQREAHRPAGGGQVPRRHEAVAAVVAGPA